MDEGILLEFMSLAEKLKCNTRHSWTSSGRRESVAEHSWRLCIFAWLVKDKFPELDMERVIKLCMFHDLGEAVTGDIPCFQKGEAQRRTEREAMKGITELLPEGYREELAGIFQEIEDGKTAEAKLMHALDKMEALIQHNEAPINTWLPLEYELQLTYGNEQAEEFAFTKVLREQIRQDSVGKIEREER